MTLPVIALVGHPNVGKSTLFNRLTRSRDALVADFPGLTRDRQYGIGRQGRDQFVIIDTGGLASDDEEIDVRVERQAWQAVVEADAVVLMTDARAGLTAADEEIVARLRRSGKRIVLAVNKAEGRDAASACAEFQSLGLHHPLAVSATHGHGVEQLITRLLESPFPAPAEATDSESERPAGGDGIRLAVVGKPNVGKSTLINRLLGEERVLAFDLPGTTRDSIHIPFERDGVHYTLIDTAGVRRRSRVRLAVEKFSIVKTLQAIESANVVVLLLDARDGITDQDAGLLGYLVERGRAMVIAVNKWDGLSRQQRSALRSTLDRKLGFIDYADIHFVSALYGSGIVPILKSAQVAHRASHSELATAELTRVLEDAVRAHQPPMVGGRRTKLRYAHQGGRNPPLIIVHGNRTTKIPPAYRRYLVNTFRKAFKLHGTAVRVEFRGGDNPYAPRSRQRGGGQG